MSLWGKDLDRKSLSSLEGKKCVDTLIIGGGIAGMTALYYLKEYPDICLVDASLVGEGVTKNTTGKLTFLQNTIYSDLEKNIDYDTAVSYFKSQKVAIELAKEIIEKEKIDLTITKEEDYLELKLQKETDLITPGLNLLLGNPYLAEAKRVIYNE